MHKGSTQQGIQHTAAKHYSGPNLSAYNPETTSHIQVCKSGFIQANPRWALSIKITAPPLKIYLSFKRYTETRKDYFKDHRALQTVTNVYNVTSTDKILTSVTDRSNLNRAQSEKNTYRCSIKSRSPQSWLMFALAHIVCRATTVASGNTVHSRFQAPVAMQPTEYFPNQTMPSPHLIPLSHAK